MSNIRVDVPLAIFDGAEVTFKSPCSFADVTGLRVYYPDPFGVTQSQDFTFADAHGNDVSDLGELFHENVMVKVILDITHNRAFVQNADTNSYIESQFANIRQTLPVVEPNKVLWAGEESKKISDVDLTGYHLYAITVAPKNNYAAKVVILAYLDAASSSINYGELKGSYTNRTGFTTIVEMELYHPGMYTYTAQIFKCIKTDFEPWGEDWTDEDYAEHWIDCSVHEIVGIL